MPALAPTDTPALAPPAVAAVNKPLEDKLTQGPADTKAELDQIEGTRESQVARLEGERGKLMPPQLQSVPAPVTKSTDPMHIWGSAAIAFAVLGSLMTRQPLMTAMNAAAGVLNAYRQNDQAAANAAFSTWKVSSENALKLYDYQTKVYEKLLGDIDRREHEADTEASHRETAAIAELRANATSFNDPLMANVRNVAEYDRNRNARDNYRLRLEEAGGKLEELHAANEALAELRDSPEYKGLDQEGRFVKEMEILKYKAPDKYKEAVTLANKQAAQMTASLNAKRQQITDALKPFQTTPPSNPGEKDRFNRLQLALQTVDAARAKMASEFAKRDKIVPLDDATVDSLMTGGSTHKPPPFPPTHEGQAKYSPDGTLWVVMGGKWTISPNQTPPK